jgi:hypothetical protein
MLLDMEVVLRYQGHGITSGDVQFLRELIAANPGMSRRQLSVKVCEAWDWRQENGRLKDMLCRSVMLALHRQNHIVLPPPSYVRVNPLASRPRPLAVEVDRTPIIASLRDLPPVTFAQVRRTTQEVQFNWLLESEHYLGYSRPVGEHLKFVASVGTRPVALFSWCSAPRHLGPRDRYIGWSPEQRQRALRLVAYNTRFLVLPWVQVKCLASHLLSRMTRMLPGEWEKVYHHPVVFAETFVDPLKHRGTCYRAANWVLMGRTTGRGKNDHTNKVNRSLKDVWGLALVENFRDRLLSA